MQIAKRVMVEIFDEYYQQVLFLFEKATYYECGFRDSPDIVIYVHNY